MGTVLQNIVEKKHYKFIDGEGVTWQEAIRLSTLSLVVDGTVTEDFYKQIIACVEKYGPYIVFEHNIAMPHTQENADGALKTGVGFMVSKKLIDFGTDEDGEEKKANVFFTLSTTNPDEHLANISQLSEIFMNDELIDALAAAETPEDILKAEKDFPCEEEEKKLAIPENNLISFTERGKKLCQFYLESGRSSRPTYCRKRLTWWAF